MASFCKQCSIDVWGEDYGDAANPENEAANRDGKFMLFLCEDCGPCQVDYTGACISPDCAKHHGRAALSPDTQEAEHGRE